MRKIIIAVIVVLLLLPATVSARSNIEVVDWDGDGRWRNDTWYVDLYPGERASIELEIESLIDAVVYAEYDSPRDLFIYFDPPALEIDKDDSEWIEITIFAPGYIEPGEYEIEFYFKTIKAKVITETKTIYRDRDVPGPIQYIDRIQYVDREIPKYMYVETKGYINWWWVPISIVFAVLVTFGISELIRRKRKI